MQKSEKFLYLAFLISSSSSWWVELSWLNSQSSQVASSWKYEQFNLNRVENVSNSTRYQFKFKISTQNLTQWSVYLSQAMISLLQLVSFLFISLSFYSNVSSLFLLVIIKHFKLISSDVSSLFLLDIWCH